MIVNKIWGEAVTFYKIATNLSERGQALGLEKCLSLLTSIGGQRRREEVTPRG